MLNLGFQNFKPIFVKKIFLVVNCFCTYGSLFELIFALVKVEDKGVRVLAGPL